MDGSEQDSVDFKPFFDMVVGVLFILLILVAAQMFFAQWQPQAEVPRPTPAEIEAQRLAALRAETDGFLKHVQSKLAAEGLTATVDALASTITLPLAQLRSRSSEQSRIDRSATHRLGRGLFVAANCLSIGLDKAQDCPVYRHLRLERVQPKLLIGSDMDAPPSRVGRVAALELSSALYGSHPELFGLLTPSGSMAMRSAIDIDVMPTPVGEGALLLRFAFVGTSPGDQ